MKSEVQKERVDDSYERVAPNLSRCKLTCSSQASLQKLEANSQKAECAALRGSLNRSEA